MNKVTFSRCLECNMIERDEWIAEDKHECNKITDYKYRVTETITLKVGKRRFIRIIVER